MSLTLDDQVTKGYRSYAASIARTMLWYPIGKNIGQTIAPLPTDKTVSIHRPLDALLCDTAP
jgi:hypothetical protein